MGVYIQIFYFLLFSTKKFFDSYKSFEVSRKWHRLFMKGKIAVRQRRTISIATEPYARGGLCKPSITSRVCITPENSLSLPSVYMRLCKLGKRALMLLVYNIIRKIHGNRKTSQPCLRTLIVRYYSFQENTKINIFVLTYYVLFYYMDNRITKLTSVFHASVLLLIMNSSQHRQSSSGSAYYFDNVMTKFHCQ